MRVIDDTSPYKHKFENCCRAQYSGNHPNIGDKVLVRRGGYIFGPMTVVAYFSKNREIAVLMDIGSNVFQLAYGEDLDPEDLNPLFADRMASVTGSEVLDGFLCAAHYEDDLLIVYSCENFPEMQQFYSSLMNDCGVEYEATDDGFIIYSAETVTRARGLMDDKPSIAFMIGYLSTFVFGVGRDTPGNPMEASQTFIIPDVLADSIEVDASLFVCPTQSRKDWCLSGIYGLFGPLPEICRANYDEVSASDNSGIHMADVKRSAAPRILFKMFELAGASPHGLKRIGEDTWKFEANIPDEGAIELTVCIGTIPDYSL